MHWFAFRDDCGFWYNIEVNDWLRELVPSCLMTSEKTARELYTNFNPGAVDLVEFDLRVKRIV